MAPGVSGAGIGKRLAVISILCNLLTGCATAQEVSPVAHWGMGDAPGMTSLADLSGHGRDAATENGIETGAGASANAASFPGETTALASFEAPALSDDRTALKFEVLAPFAVPVEVCEVLPDVARRCVDGRLGFVGDHRSEAATSGVRRPSIGGSIP